MNLKYTKILVTIGTDEYYKALIGAAKYIMRNHKFSDPAYTYEDLANDVFIKTYPSSGKVISLSGCRVLVYRFLVDKTRIKSYKFSAHSVEIGDESLVYTPEFEDTPDDCSISDSELLSKVDYYLYHANNSPRIRRYFNRSTDMLPDDVALAVKKCL